MSAPPLPADRERSGARGAGRGIARRIGYFALAFLLMTVAAVASMVRITGGRPAPVARATASPAASLAPDDLPAIRIPVAGISASQITDTWGASRDHGGRVHQGTDIMAPGGTPALAVAPGTIEKLYDSTAGGHTLYLRSDDRRWTYYYAHLAGYAAAAVEGRHVAAGDAIAFVGDTGNAGAGNYHLHFGVSRMRPDQRWWEGTPINPYPLLVAARGRR